MTPKEQAITLLAEFAAAQAALKAATAPYEADAARINAAIAKATAAEKTRLDEAEEQLKKLALEHGAEIFGADKRSLAENGFVLALRETASVQVEDEEAAIRMLMNDAARARKGSDTAMACNACVRVTAALDREYITRHFDESPAWFAGYGIAVVDKISASVKPAPKTRAAKPKKMKAGEEPQHEAA